jgi:hypothetical protein
VRGALPRRLVWQMIGGAKFTATTQPHRVHTAETVRKVRAATSLDRT